MSAEHLIAHYERVADAPHAIERMRRFVISMAVRGKLVRGGDREWKTSPLEECLAPLADGRLIHQGWSPQCDAIASPADTVWGVLKTTAIQDGAFVPKHNKQLPDKFEARPKLEVSAGDILITCAGPRARCGVPCLVRETRPKLMISGKMYRFRAHADLLDPLYLELYLRSDRAQSAINQMKSGSSESGLNLTHDRFRKLAISYGGLDEQRRIVARVAEMMALCDRLEAAQEAREATRDRLVAASLARLNAPSPDTFPEDACLALGQFRALTTRADQISLLRQAIRSLAVQGRLTVRGEEYSQSSSSSSTPSDAPFDLPDGWSWTSLGRLISDGPRNGISPKLSRRADAARAITLTATTSGWFDARHTKLVEGSYPADSENWLRPGDLLFQRGNTLEYVGMAAYYDGPPGQLLYPDLMIKVRIGNDADLRFVHLCAIAPYARAFFARRASGAQATMPKINQSTLLALPIPLPPLADQKRIVAKVAILMALCDQLEKSLNAESVTRQNLLTALLHDTLHDGPMSEAA